MLRQNHDPGQRLRQGGEGGPERRPDAARRRRASARPGHSQHHGKCEESRGAGWALSWFLSHTIINDSKRVFALVWGCTITVANVCVQIRNILKQGIETPEDQNDLRKMQLRELARLNGTLREDDNRSASLWRLGKGDAVEFWVCMIVSAGSCVHGRTLNHEASPTPPSVQSVVERDTSPLTANTPGEGGFKLFLLLQPYLCCSVHLHLCVCVV